MTMFSIFVLLSFTEKPMMKLFFLWEDARLLNAFTNAGIFSWEFSLLHMHTYLKMQKAIRLSIVFWRCTHLRSVKMNSYTLQNSLKAKQLQTAQLLNCE